MNQQNMPLVTAVIPVYNHEKYVVESIRSIIAQTYANLELIVINDGSKDRSHEMILPLIEECRQRFVRFEYINRENIGLSATLNQALAWAQGEYLSALASDDVALPEKIEVLVAALEEKGPTYAAAFGNALFIDAEGHRICLGVDGSVTDSNSTEACDNFLDFYTRGRGLNYRGEDFGTYASLISGNYLPAMSNVVRTAAIVQAGGWTPGNVVEDWEMWLKLSKTKRFWLINEPLALYRMHGSNTARTVAGGLLYPLFLLIKREECFCKDNDLISKWKNATTSLAYLLIVNPHFPARKKWSVLKAADKTPLIRHVTRRLFNLLDVRSLFGSKGRRI